MYIYNLQQLKKNDLNLKVIDHSSLNLTEDDKKLRMKAKQIYENYFLNEKLSCITTEKYRNEVMENIKHLQEVRVQAFCVILIEFFLIRV